MVNLIRIVIRRRIIKRKLSLRGASKNCGKNKRFEDIFYSCGKSIVLKSSHAGQPETQSQNRAGFIKKIREVKNLADLIKNLIVTRWLFIFFNQNDIVLIYKKKGCPGKNSWPKPWVGSTTELDLKTLRKSDRMKKNYWFKRSQQKTMLLFQVLKSWLKMNWMLRHYLP